MKIFRAINLIAQLFKRSWRLWIHSKQFKRSGFYVIVAALSAYLSMFIFIFLTHNYILAVIMFAFGCFDWMFNWYLWVREEYNKHYKEKE